VLSRLRGEWSNSGEGAAPAQRSRTAQRAPPERAPHLSHPFPCLVRRTSRARKDFVKRERWYRAPRVLTTLVSTMEALASSVALRSALAPGKEHAMARKTVLISDQSGDVIEEGKGAKVRITFNDARRGVRELDLTDAEAERLGGRPVARRGRKPKNA
jgi:hypothetical protein